MAKTDISIASGRRTLLLYALLLCLIILMANWQLGGDFFLAMRALPGGDKAGHFVLMGVFALLMNRLYQGARVRIGPLCLLKGSLVVVVLVGLEECLQVLIPSRSFSWSDLFFDLAGILCLGWLGVPRGS